MKKIMSFILACVLCVALIPSSAFADTVPADDLFGVIVDADGNVVEYLQMPRGDTYVNKIYTIPSGHSLISLQYSLTQSFLFGYATTDYDKKTFITEPYSSFEMCIELSNTVGGGNRVILNDYIYRDTLGGPGYGTVGASIYCGSDQTNYKYCNGKLVNKSSFATTVRIVVVRDYDWDNDDPRDYL